MEKEISREIGLVGVERAAQLLGIRTSTLYVWCEQERIPHVRLGRSLRFEVDALQRWIAEHRVEARDG